MIECYKQKVLFYLSNNPPQFVCSSVLVKRCWCMFMNILLGMGEQACLRLKGQNSLWRTIQNEFLERNLSDQMY